MMPSTVATWYVTSSEPRSRAGADSAMNTGITVADSPIVMPSNIRAAISHGIDTDAAASSENTA